MKNGEQKIKKGDWVRVFVHKNAFIDIAINYSFKVYFVGYGGIIVEIPESFHSVFFSPWLGMSQGESIINTANLFPDKLYYFFSKWEKINKKLKI